MSIRSTVRNIILIAVIVAVMPGVLSVAGNPGGWAHADVDSPEDRAVDQEALDILLNWGMHALETERYSEAEVRFLKVLELDWNHPQAFSLLQKTRNQREQAFSQWFREAEQATADNRWDRALDLYKKIQAEDPKNWRAALGVSRVERRRQVDDLVTSGMERFIMGDYPAALAQFEQALVIDPSDSLAALYAQRAEQETVQSSSLADLRSDGAVWSTYLDALKRFRAGDLVSAESLWRQILDKYPGNEAVLSNLEQVIRRKRSELSAQDMAP